MIVKDPIPFVLLLEYTDVDEVKLGLGLVLHTIPRSVKAELPALVTLPPPVALCPVIEVTGFVVTVGADRVTAAVVN